MPTSALLLLGAAVAGYLVLAPLRRALLGALAAQVLLPGVLVVPNPLSAYPTFGRVALVALAANVARRWWRGDLADDAWRWTPVHAALALLVLVGLVNGVLLAQPELSTWDTLHGWASLVDQLVLFALATAVLRTDPDPRWLLRGIGAVVVASATLGALEHLTGGAWGHWLFSHHPSLQGLDAAHALDLRGGRTRVRAGAEFALEFAWVSVMLLPALVAATTLLPRRNRGLGLALPVLVVAAVYWSYSRSPLPFVAVGVVAVWAGSSFSRRVGALLATLVVGGALFVLTSPNLLTPLTTSSNQATVDVRRERLPRVAALVADRPVQGLGIGGLDRAGIPTTDASYQRAYGQFGVVGVTWLVVTVAVAIGATARSLRARSRLGRTAGAAMTAGVVAGAFGAASFDLFSLSGSAAVFWLLVGGGVVLGEQAGGRAPVWRESAGRAGVVLVAVASGTVLAIAWPRQVVGTARYALLSPAREAVDPKPPYYGDEVLRRTVCGEVELYGRATPGVALACRESAPLSGITEIRIAASSVQRFEGARDAVAVITGRHLGARAGLGSAAAPRWVRPTVARTAPVWLGLLGLGLALFVPALRLRRWAVATRVVEAHLARP